MCTGREKGQGGLLGQFLSSCLFFELKITHKQKYCCLDFICTQMIFHTVHGIQTAFRKGVGTKNTEEV